MQLSSATSDFLNHLQFPTLFHVVSMVAWREFLVDWLVRLEQSIVVLREELSMTRVICRHVKLRIMQNKEEIEHLRVLVREREREHAERYVHDDDEGDSASSTVAGG
jgi:hypothetical protein